MDGEEFKSFCENGGKAAVPRAKKEKSDSIDGEEFPDVPDLSGFFSNKDDDS